SSLSGIRKNKESGLTSHPFGYPQARARCFRDTPCRGWQGVSLEWRPRLSQEGGEALQHPDKTRVAAGIEPERMAEAGETAGFLVIDPFRTKRLRCQGINPS